MSEQPLQEPPRQDEGNSDETAQHDRAPKDAPRDSVTFSPERFERECLIDLVLRRGMLVLALLALLFLLILDQSNTTLGLMLVILVLFLWMGIGSIGANVWRMLPHVTAMIGQDPAAAEAHLANMLNKYPLMPWLRLLLYHRLAAIRHRQHRFAESAMICQAVLSKPLGPARRQRGSLLLMLAEASMQCHDLYGAYMALSALQGEPLNIAERLQRLAIQTRYEVLGGHDRAALHDIRQKLLMAELMPAEHCGAMHAMLTASAKRAGRRELAEWLWKRSELLCGREKLDRLIRSAFAIGVVGPPE